MTVLYDPAQATPDELAQVITQGRFTASVREAPAANLSTMAPELAPAPIPEEAPKSFVQAFDEARTAKCPLVLVFGAEWCPACQRLKEETLRHPDVASRLSCVKVFECDLDKSLELGHWYGVTAVPHVVFIDRNGLIVDEVRDFEPPDAFLVRLEKLMHG